MSYNVIYMWNLKCDTNELVYKTETDPQTESRAVATKGEVREAGRSVSPGLADVHCYMYRMDEQKELLHSTGN